MWLQVSPWNHTFLRQEFAYLMQVEEGIESGNKGRASQAATIEHFLKATEWHVSYPWSSRGHQYAAQHAKYCLANPRYRPKNESWLVIWNMYWEATILCWNGQILQGVELSFGIHDMQHVMTCYESSTCQPREVGFKGRMAWVTTIDLPWSNAWPRSLRPLTHELYASIQGPSCCNKVIDQHHPLSRLDCPFVHLDLICAVLCDILLRDCSTCP